MSGPSYISRPSTPTYGGRPMCAGTDNLGLTGWATTLALTCLVYAAPAQCPERGWVAHSTRKLDSALSCNCWRRVSPIVIDDTQMPKRFGSPISTTTMSTTSPSISGIREDLM